MDKKEKYYKFIVDHMLKDTKDDSKYIHTPYGISSNYTLFTNPTDIRDSMYSAISGSLTRYLVSKYGIQQEELYPIWDIYRESIITLIDNG